MWSARGAGVGDSVFRSSTYPGGTRYEESKAEQEGHPTAAHKSVVMGDRVSTLHAPVPCIWMGNKRCLL